VPDPPQADGVLAVSVGTVLWGLAVLVLLAFRGRLEDHDATWWIWVAVAGFGLGVFGTWYVRRRRDAYRAAHKSAAEPSTGPS